MPNFTEDLGYKYPKEMDLQPGSDTHDKIVSFVRERVEESYRVMSARYSTWNELDRVTTLFVEPTLEEEQLKAENERQPVGIVIPTSFAILEVLLTYAASTLLEDPILRYRPTDRKDLLGAMAHEALAHYQISRNKGALELHSALRDSFIYGIGGIAIDWDRQFGYKTVKQIGMLKSILRSAGLTGLTDRTRQLVYEGNKFDALDPYKLYPDVNTPIHKFQKGEYCAWLEETNYYNLLSRERDMTEDGDASFFNARYLEDQQDAYSKIIGNDVSARTERFGQSSKQSSTYTRSVDVLWIVAKIIPSELELGSSDYPEKWLIGLAADSVIIHAKQLPYDHDLIPIAVCAPFADGHTVCPVSPVEVSYGMQKGVDFLWNNHMDNLARAVKLMLIVDPYLINVADMTESRNGWLIRMRKSAWGLGKIDEAVKQLQISDVTRNNVSDMLFLKDFMQYSTGATDSVAGVVHAKRERISAEEARGARLGGVSRLEHISWMAGWQLMYDAALMVASNNKQFMTEARSVRLIGEYMKSVSEDLGIDQEYVNVDPLDLDVELDIMPQPNQLPGAVDVTAMIEMFKTIAQNPQLTQQFAIGKMFRFIARQAGARGIENFELRSMPDEQVTQQMDAGNLVPLAEGSSNGTVGAGLS